MNSNSHRLFSICVTTAVPSKLYFCIEFYTLQCNTICDDMFIAQQNTCIYVIIRNIFFQLYIKKVLSSIPVPKYCLTLLIGKLDQLELDILNERLVEVNEFAVHPRHHTVVGQPFADGQSHVVGRGGPGFSGNLLPVRQSYPKEQRFQNTFDSSPS